MLRHDDGQPMTLKQVCDEAWNQFGPAAIMIEFAGRIAWNAKFMAQIHAEQISKDAESLASIGERFERLWNEMEEV